MRTSVITINGVKTEIEEPETNKMYEELTRMITLTRYWDNKPMSRLLRICLTARDRKKMIFGHPKNASAEEKKFNTFYSDTYNSRDDGFSIFVSSISVLINDKEVTPAEAYMRLLRAGICSFSRKNPFGVIREGNILNGYSYKVLKEIPVE